MPSDKYSVDDVAAAREVDPFCGDYSDGEHVEFNCPSCAYSVLAADLVKAGGTTCDGCGRSVRLHLTSHNHYGEWRTVPQEEEEVYR